MTDIRAEHVQTPALVYLRGMRGVAVPQIWHEPQCDHAGYWRGKILAWHSISRAMAGLPYRDLTKLFPPPIIEDIA